MKDTARWVFIVFIGSALLSSCVENKTAKERWRAPASAQDNINPVRYDVASVNRGKILFDKHCQVCHGYWGEGNGVVGLALDKRPANLLHLAGKKAEGEFAWKIAEGRGDMPSFRNKLSEEEIWNIVNFIQSLENEDAPDVPLVKN